MKKLFRFLTITREERWPAVVALLWFVGLNALTVTRYFTDFSQISSHYHKLFVGQFRVSGFDPLTYEVVSSWTTAYNVYRHPLLAFFMWVPNQLNQALIWATGMNFATIITAAILVVCAVYSFVFLYRILRRVVQVGRGDALLLCAYFFSFAYVMLSIMVPDHFCLSMMMLLITLYVAGIRQQEGRRMTIVETLLLFVFTAGISLNNGLKTFLAALFTNRWRFFRPKFLLLAVVLPALLMWGFARWEYRTFVWPKEMARKEAKAREVKRHHDAIYRQFTDTTSLTDSAAIKAGVQRVIRQKAMEKYRRDHQQVWNKNAGKPIAKGEFSRWTDISTPRWDSAVENLFGEGLLLHRTNLLEDVLRSRPVIVRYTCASYYIVELLIILLFLLGIWLGRRERFLWTALSFFLLDMALHVGLGFGLNEVYIMTAHWAFVLPIASAYTLREAKAPSISPKGERLRWTVRAILVLTTLFLLVNNAALIIEFMTR